MAAQQRLSIVEGPSKFDLIVSLFDGKWIRFTIEGIMGQGKEGETGTSRILILSVGREAVGLDKWSISGSIMGGHYDGRYHKSGSFSGCYDSCQRKGWIDPTDKLI